ncbi:MAG: hypothetical protein ACOY7J_09525, partial [Pseudomonadota bacterium]
LQPHFPVLYRGRNGRVAHECIVDLRAVTKSSKVTAEDVAKRPDVLVIESGEIRLPGEVHMKNIGLPKNVAYACLAETIVLALEGRFENYTLGRNIEWEKVREIYKLGLKHGMQLASISGVNGVYSDADLAQVRQLALEKLGQPLVPARETLPELAPATTVEFSEIIKRNRKTVDS